MPLIMGIVIDRGGLELGAGANSTHADTPETIKTAFRVGGPISSHRKPLALLEGYFKD